MGPLYKYLVIMSLLEFLNCLLSIGDHELTDCTWDDRAVNGMYDSYLH